MKVDRITELLAVLPPVDQEKLLKQLDEYKQAIERLASLCQA